MLTTVTGIAPIVSMMRSKNLDKSEHNIWIYEGASYIDEFGYDYFYYEKNRDVL